MATADHVIQATKGIKKSFDNATKLDIDQFKSLGIFNIESTSEFTEILSFAPL